MDERNDMKRKKKPRKPRTLKISDCNLLTQLQGDTIEIEAIKWGTYIDPLYAKEARELADWLLKAADYLESKE